MAVDEQYALALRDLKRLEEALGHIMFIALRGNPSDFPEICNLASHALCPGSSGPSLPTHTIRSPEALSNSTQQGDA